MAFWSASVSADACALRRSRASLLRSSQLRLFAEAKTSALQNFFAEAKTSALQNFFNKAVRASTTMPQNMSFHLKVSFLILLHPVYQIICCIALLSLCSDTLAASPTARPNALIMTLSVACHAKSVLLNHRRSEDQLSTYAETHQLFATPENVYAPCFLPPYYVESPAICSQCGVDII